MPTKPAQRRMKIDNPPTSPFRKVGCKTEKTFEKGSNLPLFFKEGFGEITKKQ